MHGPMYVCMYIYIHIYIYIYIYIHRIHSIFEVHCEHTIIKVTVASIHCCQRINTRTQNLTMFYAHKQKHNPSLCTKNTEAYPGSVHKGMKFLTSLM